MQRSKLRVHLQRVHVQILMVLLLAYASMGAGCPKDPYRAALAGSDDVSQAVASGVKIATKYYSLGKFTDQQKAVAAQILTNVTEGNMKFRHGAVDLHNAGVVGKAQYVGLAQAFINSIPEDAAQLHYFSGDSQKLYYEVMGPLRTAVNGIALAIQNAKGV